MMPDCPLILSYIDFQTRLLSYIDFQTRLLPVQTVPSQWWFQPGFSTVQLLVEVTNGSEPVLRSASSTDFLPR
jgi:hypothetical protein